MASYQVTHIHMSDGGSRHEHIEQLHVVGQSGKQWLMRKQVVDAIRAGNTFFTQVGNEHSFVKVVNATPPYVQTYADNTLTDNLLSLPRM